MVDVDEPLVVSEGTCRCCSAPTTLIHHRDYPEAEVEGVSAVMAAQHLAAELTRSLDHAPDHDRRAAVERALAEVQEFMNRHDPSPCLIADGTVTGENLMALPHAQPGQVIDVHPYGTALGEFRTTALVKSASLEVIRLVVPRGKEIPPHKTRGEVTVQCLEGRVAFTTDGVTHELEAGHLIYLRGEQLHAVRGIDDASLLVTISLSPSA